MTETINIGKNIARLRDLRGMKQEELAEVLGVSQQAVSRIEQSESIEDATLERVAKALGVTPGIVKAFNQESAIYNIQNNYENTSQNVYNQFNPIEKIAALYDELLKSERDKIALLERVIKKLEG